MKKSEGTHAPQAPPPQNDAYEYFKEAYEVNVNFTDRIAILDISS